MQVFCPFLDIKESVSCLDNKRLGNQIYRECLTLINGGWKNHPASKIWANYKYGLAKYALYGLEELSKRNRNYPHHRETFLKILKNTEDTGFPDVVGYEPFHLSHRSNLARKNPLYYLPIFGAGTPLDLPYIWKK